MPQVTGGQVVYGRTVQPAQYESKKAEVTLTFGLDEGTAPEAAAAFIQSVADDAIAQAHRMVGIGVPAEPAVAAKQKPAEPKQEPAKTSTKEEAAANLNAKDAAKSNKTEIDLGDTKPAISTGEERKDPKQADPDGLDLEGGTTPITDTMLQEAVQAKMKEINDGKRIKAVREKYVQVPKAIKDIPQEQRAAFLADIKALVKE